MNSDSIDPAVQLARLSELVSQRTGLIKYLNRRPYSAEEPALPIIFDAELSHFDFRKGDIHERGSCGKGLNEETAMLSAIGECIERYCASHPRAKKAQRAFIGDLHGEMIPPNEFVLYSSDQYAKRDFPFRPWKQTDVIPWLAVEEIAGYGQVWVPASLLYLNYSGTEPQDILVRPSSNGFAAGPDLPSAIRAALCETLERDAFLITWLNRLPVREIIDSRVDSVEASIRHSFSALGVNLRLFLLPTDMPAACVLALAQDTSGHGPATVLGLACDLDPAVAVRKALFEICQVHGPFRRKYAEITSNRLNQYSDVATLADHAAFFFNPDHSNELDFILGANVTVSFDELPVYGGQSVSEDIELLGQAIRAAGSRAFWLDITTPDLHEYPISVARVLVTDFQPIHFGYGQERLGGRRLYELPAKLGLTKGPTSEAMINPCPHPLA